MGGKAPHISCVLLEILSSHRINGARSSQFYYLAVNEIS